MITGKRVILKPLEQHEIANVLAIIHIPEVSRYLLSDLSGLTASNCLSFLAQTGAGTSCLALGIYEKESLGLIGFAVVNNIHPVHRSAHLRFVAIHPDYWNKRYGADVSYLLIKMLCLEKNIRRITTTTIADHVSMDNVKKRHGFMIEGVERQAVYYNGKWCDLNRWALLRKDIDWDSYTEVDHG